MPSFLPMSVSAPSSFLKSSVRVSGLSGFSRKSLRYGFSWNSVGMNSLNSLGASSGGASGMSTLLGVFLGGQALLGLGLFLHRRQKGARRERAKAPVDVPAALAVGRCLRVDADGRDHDARLVPAADVVEVLQDLAAVVVLEHLVDAPAQPRAALGFLEPRGLDDLARVGLLLAFLARALH